MSEFEKYSINTEILFDYMETIDIREIINSSKEKWQNYSLCKVNDNVVRIGIIQGEFHWHKHDSGDEFFLVLDGKLIIEFGDRLVELLPLQSIVIPKGMMHKTKAPERTSILMIEDLQIKPTGD